MLPAAAVAVVHAAAVVFMLVGGLLALRRPRLLWVHVPVTVAIAVIYLLGADCPLTTLELALRARAGLPRYTGGFLGHYVTGPLGFPIRERSTQVGVLVVAVVPNAIAYGLLARRWLRRRAADRRDQLSAAEDR